MRGRSDEGDGSDESVQDLELRMLLLTWKVHSRFGLRQPRLFSNVFVRSG